MKKSVSEILFDQTELTELKSQELINTQITYYQASQDQRRGFSKNLSLGIRKILNIDENSGRDRRNLRMS